MAQEMTEEHKRALAKGRRQAKAVRDYLDALEWKDSRRSRLDREDLDERIRKTQEQIEEEDDRAKQVELIQKRIDYEQRREDLDEAPDIEQRKDDFVDAVMEYSERKGISYMAWREAGVPAAVLREAGMKRTYTPPDGDDS